MRVPTDAEFDTIISEALDTLPKEYVDRLMKGNVAIIYADEPSQEQREKLKLHCNQLLFGLYEGVPLPARHGQVPLLPDKITIFKHSIALVSEDLDQLKKQVRKTVWHEMAHYFGLDHKRIHELE